MAFDGAKHFAKFGTWAGLGLVAALLSGAGLAALLGVVVALFFVLTFYNGLEARDKRAARKPRR